MAIAGYAASAPIMVWAVSAVGGKCRYSQLATDCDFGRRVFDPLAYAALMGVTIIAMLALKALAKDRVWYPLTMLFGSLALFTCSWDLVLRRPVIGVDHLVDDTFNTLRFTIAASFLLVFLVARRVQLPMLRAALAVIASNAAAVAAAIVFLELSRHVMGATKMYLLFMLYAFGGFGVHIMAASWMFSAGRMDAGPHPIGPAT